jgi:hypothetical protein
VYWLVQTTTEASTPVEKRKATEEPEGATDNVKRSNGDEKEEKQEVASTSEPATTASTGMYN